MITIYRQEILNDISLFTSAPKQKFYDNLFLSLNLDFIPQHNAKAGRKGEGNHAYINAFIVMQCEGFSQISDLYDYLQNNLIIAQFCGFNIFKMPSYASFTRFIRNFDNGLLEEVMQHCVKQAFDLEIISTDFLALDSTPIKANVCNNNPKSFSKNKFTKDNKPKADKDCTLGVHSASNKKNEQKFDYYWGYKNHILVDCKSGLPVCEITTGANVADSTVTLDILKKTSSFLPLKGFNFLADKAYDTKAIYNEVKYVYGGNCFIPLNTRNTKNPASFAITTPICDGGLSMHKCGTFSDNGRTRQKYCCPFKSNKKGICPCNHKNWNNGKKNRGCTRYFTLPTDYRLQIDHNAISFKSVYSLRTEAERYNSRFKQTAGERAFVRNINSVQNLNTLAHISLLSIAITAVSLGKSNLLRSLKSIKRLA
ncbi:MAG: transposase [Anaerotignaceae bacterium]